MVAGGQYGVKEGCFLLFIFATLKLLMQMTQKRKKCEDAKNEPLIAGVMWESDGR